MLGGWSETEPMMDLPRAHLVALGVLGILAVIVLVLVLTR